ncbi:hypothetical protein P4O66_001470, partial [Electrophorus voltai]
GGRPSPPRAPPTETSCSLKHQDPEKGGREEEAAHKEAPERVHALHERDEGQSGGRVHAEGERRHQPDPGQEVACSVSRGAGQILRACQKRTTVTHAALPRLVGTRQTITQKAGHMHFTLQETNGKRLSLPCLPM